MSASESEIRNGRTITWRLEGPSVEDGTVPVDKLVHVLSNLQGALRRLAENVLDQSKGRKRGPPPRTLAEEATLRLVSIKGGSFQAVLELPSTPPQRKLWQVGEEALEQLLAGLEAAAEQQDFTAFPAVALPEVHRLTQIIGDGITRLTFEGGATKRHVARFEAPAEVPAATPQRRGGSVSGRLREVDFKDHTAELYDATGRMTRVRFTPEQEADLKAAANLNVTVTGELEEGAAGRPASITVEKVETAWQGDQFWISTDVERLAQEQGVRPLDVSSLEPAPFWPKKSDPEDFVSEIYADRRREA
jgi:hypothetical protein